MKDLRCADPKPFKYANGLGKVLRHVTHLVELYSPPNSDSIGHQPSLTPESRPVCYGPDTAQVSFRYTRFWLLEMQDTSRYSQQHAL
jgi:hypothetical protein